MILKLISSLFLITTLYSADNIQLDQAYSNNVENSNEYITASVMYSNKEYDKSFKMFKKMFLENNDNININYFLALSAIKIGLIGDATAALERILIKKPDFNQARLIYAKLLFDLNLKSESKKEFELLKNSNISKEAKELVEDYLKQLEIKEKNYSLNSIFLAGVGRSSNANSGYDNPIYSGYEFGEKPIYDNMHHEMLAVNYNKYFEEISNTIFANKFMFYNKSYFNEKKQNLKIYAYKPSIIYQNNENTIYALNFGISKIDKESNNNFNLFEISPSFKNDFFYTSLTYQRILYQEEKDSDGNFNKYDFLLKYELLNDLSVYTKVSTINSISNRSDINRNSILGGMEYTYKINNDDMILFNLEYLFTKYKYNYINILFDKKREDENIYSSISYVYKINKTNQLIFSTSYTKNISTYDINEYKEIEGKINYVKLFNY